MSAELTERTLGIWYADIENGGATVGNWIATVEHALEGGYLMTYRFRWYRDEKIFDSQDERSGGEVGSGELEKLLACCRLMLKAHAARGSSTYELMRGADTVEQFTQRLIASPFAHSKKVSKEEYESYQAKKKRG
jgi:hypothetical protein